MKVGVQFFILLIVSLTARGAAGEDGGDPGGIRWLPDRIRDWHYFEFSHDDGWTQSYRLVPTGGGVPFRFWDRAFLSRAVTAQHYDQLRPLFERLSRGEPLTVLAIGSSVTALHAGCMHGPTPLVQATANLRHGNLSLPECRHDGWLSRVLRMINGTWPHQNHTLLNLAWPGSTMDRFTRRWCHTELLGDPPVFDLVVVDQHDAVATDPKKQTPFPAFEELMQTLHFVMRGRPVPVLLLSVAKVFTFTSRMLHPQFRKPIVDYSLECLKMCTKRTAWPRTGELPPFSENCLNFTVAPMKYGLMEEDRHAPVLHHYGVTEFSLRRLWYSVLRDRMHDALGVTLCELTSLFYMDWIHPSVFVSVMISDMIMDHLATAQRLLYQSDAASSPRMWGALHTTRWPEAPAFGALTQMQRPFHCWDGAVPRDSDMPVASVEGFKFVTHEIVRGQEVPKAGWVAFEPDSRLVLNFSSYFGDNFGGAGAPPAGSAQLPAEVTLVYLESYEHMGVANVACVDGCACEPRDVNAHTLNERTSVENTVTFNVTQAEHCVLAIRVLRNTTSGENKWKFLGLTVFAPAAAGGAAAAQQQ